ncbi:hypothetical protein D3C72_1005360 [compost metagenome]
MILAKFSPCSPSGMAQPIMTSSTSSFLSPGARSITASSTTLPRSSARVCVRLPFFALPIAVRAIDTITASFIVFSHSLVVDFKRPRASMILTPSALLSSLDAHSGCGTSLRSLLSPDFLNQLLHCLNPGTKASASLLQDCSASSVTQLKAIHSDQKLIKSVLADTHFS